MCSTRQLGSDSSCTKHSVTGGASAMAEATDRALTLPEAPTQLPSAVTALGKAKSLGSMAVDRKLVIGSSTHSSDSETTRRDGEAACGVARAKEPSQAGKGAEPGREKDKGRCQTGRCLIIFESST
eukprot:364687-Chlamydomonas_euryale.AAC.2